MKVWADSIKNVAAIILLAYPLTKYLRFRGIYLLSPTSGDRWVLSFFFGTLSILSMSLGTEVFNGALLDSRNVGPTVGGMVAGPLVGFAAGTIGAVYRLVHGGFTAIPDAMALPLCGLLGSCIHEKYGDRRFQLSAPLCIGLAAEVTNKILVLLLARPFILAEALNSWIATENIIVNGLGIALFVNLLGDIQYSHYAIGTSYAIKAFNIAEQTLPVVAEDLDAATAEKIAAIIHQEATVDAVAVTGNGKILAFKGIGSDHHRREDPAPSRNSEFSQKDDTGRLIAKSIEFRCPTGACSLRAVVAAPLMRGSARLGTLEIYKAQDIVYPPDIKLATAIAGLLSMQFVNARAYRQESLLVQAEYEALRAQIHPHFLFNALSVIKVLIREEPERAQDLLVTLAQYLRRSFGTRPELIPFSDELKGVEFYLAIQQARFGKRLQVTFQIAEEACVVPFPPFAVQPLVENALNHGFVGDNIQMNLLISARVDDHSLVVEVVDDGIGIPAEVIEAIQRNVTVGTMGVGLTNIHRRLRILYGRNCEFRLLREQPGTRVIIRIPLLPEEGRAAT